MYKILYKVSKFWNFYFKDIQSLEIRKKIHVIAGDKLCLHKNDWQCTHCTVHCQHSGIIQAASNDALQPE